MTAYIAQAVIFFIIFFLGVIGNSVVLYVLLRQKKWSITATYLFNLAVADTMFVCILPFWGHYHLNELGWKFGTPMCKASATITNLNMYASIFFLTAISADRWLAIVHATRMNQRRNTIYTRWICAGVWFVSLILCLPSILYREVRFQPVHGCRPNLTTSVQTNLTTFSPETQPVSICVFYIPSSFTNKEDIMAGTQLLRSILGFIVPVCVISFCYIRIVWTVKRKVINKRIRKDKVARLAAFVITAFIICWTPYHVINLYSALGGWLRLFLVDPCFYNKVKPFTICLAYANSCINPIVYAFTTTKFQENMREICSSDKSPRPYRMVLTNPNEDKLSKTQALALTFRRNNTERQQKQPERFQEMVGQIEQLITAHRSKICQVQVLTSFLRQPWSHDLDSNCIVLTVLLLGYDSLQWLFLLGCFEQTANSVDKNSTKSILTFGSLKTPKQQEGISPNTQWQMCRSLNS